MIDHKPECSMRDEQWPKHPLEVCEYCDMIAACEKRVLDAAREAVAALDIGRDVRFSADVRADALAAIDALREEKP